MRYAQRKNRRPQDALCFRPCLELLEGRLLLSATSPEQGYFAVYPVNVPITSAPLDTGFTGVVLAIPWNSVQPTQNVFDWSQVDSQVQAAGAAGLKVVLDLEADAGRDTPSWVTTNPLVQTITLTDTYVAHQTYGQNLTGPVFWDPTYLQDKDAFIAAAGARYATNPLVVGVNVSFANWYTYDWNVPTFMGTGPGGAALDQLQQWIGAGYTIQKMLTAGEQTIDATAAAFPTQALKLPIHGDNAALDGTNTALATQVLNYGFTKYPTRFIAEIDYLSTTMQPAGSSKVVNASPATDYYLLKLLTLYSPEIGVQTQFAATNGMGNCGLNGGASPCPDFQTLQNALIVGQSYNPAYVEVFPQDATNPALASLFVPPPPPPPPPPTGPNLLVTGADAGGGPEVKVFNTPTGGLKFDFYAYNPAFLGGVRVALADVNGDGTPDIITGPGPTGGPEIKVFDGKTGAIIRDFFAFDPNFKGGVWVAGGDVNGDGFADIIVGADAGGGPEVAVFSGKDGSLLTAFFPYDPNFQGGVRVAAADVNHDGIADIITAPGAGGGPEVRVYEGDTPTIIGDYMAFDPSFSGGVFVAGGDTLGNGTDNVIASGGNEVRVFNGASQTILEDFFAAPSSFTGGMRVAAHDVFGTGKASILAGTGPGASTEVLVVDPSTTLAVDSFFVYPTGFLGGLYVG
jgi:hypothetical protein